MSIYYVNRGDTGLAMRQTENARKDYIKALEPDPKCLAAYYQLSNIYLNENKYNEALQTINKAISVADSFYPLFLQRAFINYKLEKFREAADDYQKVLSLNPENSMAQFGLGQACLKFSMFDKSISQYEKSIITGSKNPKSGKPQEYALMTRLSPLPLRASVKLT